YDVIAGAMSIVSEIMAEAQFSDRTRFQQVDRLRWLVYPNPPGRGGTFIVQEHTHSLSRSRSRSRSVTDGTRVRTIGTEVRCTVEGFNSREYAEPRSRLDVACPFDPARGC